MSKQLADELVKAVRGNKHVFELYEQEIGLPPMVSDMLADAESEYPEEWIASAIAEAAKRNARNWSYVSKILENRKNSNGHVGVGGKPQVSIEAERERKQNYFRSLQEKGIVE